MGRKCLVCGELFGCTRGGIKYLCVPCRLSEGCGIRNHFTTTCFTKEICPDCLFTHEGDRIPVAPTLATGGGTAFGEAPR